MQRGKFKFLVMLKSFKIPLKIGIPFSFANFTAMIVQFSFKKSKFEDFKSSQ